MKKSNYSNTQYDKSDEASIIEYAKKLEGKTFQWVLDLGIEPEGISSEYDAKGYKGGMGNLIEERYFGYKKNNSEEPDFKEVNLELKTTCLDKKAKTGDIQPGERLVITMIPFNRAIPSKYENSHLANKLGNVLLVFYLRDKTIPKYNQIIKKVIKLEIPRQDLKIIKDDYKKIVELIQEGKAEDLSEGLTSYLGACTKGSTAEKSQTKQFYPPHNLAKSRAFCLKHSYMKFAWKHYINNEKSPSSIIHNQNIPSKITFEDFVISLINKNIGKSDLELSKELGLDFSLKNKGMTTQIVRALLGVKTTRIAEFEKSNTEVKVVRLEKGMKNLKESISLKTQTFKSLLEEKSWEDSKLYTYFMENRFFFVIFEKDENNISTLKGAKFWNMSTSDINGELKRCWTEARKTLRKGVQFTIKLNQDGSVNKVLNNLPSAKENQVAHMRPHAKRSAYKLNNGYQKGDLEKDADTLPDGQMMTKQSFWLNSKYIYEIVTNPSKEDER